VLPLQKAGYQVLLFDFRGHGQSGGSGSTLGGDEAQDVVAALDFLAAQEGVDAKRLGGWGRGVGAYALALAAKKRGHLRALALDSLYPEARAILAEKLFPGTDPLEAPLSWIAAQEFRWLFGPRSAALPMAAVLPELGERSFFVVVSRDEPRRALAARALMEQIPEGKDGEKNLLELEAAWSQNLYGEDRERYEREVSRFFLRALPLDGRSFEDSSPLSVMEG
jgi:pimeloyl-ACP methyl ester carboxylesterase